MFNPIPPSEPDRPGRRREDEAGERARFPVEDDYENRFRLRRRPRSDLSGLELLLCIFCSGIGCIVGVVKLIQGEPNAGKMIGLSLIFAMVWAVVRLVVISALQGPAGSVNFR
jgi:hypothetical protein